MKLLERKGGWEEVVLFNVTLPPGANDFVFHATIWVQPNPAGLLVTVVKDNNKYYLAQVIMDGCNAQPTNKFNIGPNQTLTMNQYVVAQNQQHYAIMQGDGNMLYKGSGPSNSNGAIWAEYKRKWQSYAIMQSDGNFVVYKGSGRSDNKGVAWASNTSGKGQSYAIMQNDGNFVVYKGSGPSDNNGATWATGTNN